MKKFNQVIQRGRMGSEPPQSSAGSTLSAKSPLSSPAGSSTFLGSSSAPPMAPRRQIRRGDTHKGLLQASARDRSFTVDHGDLPDASTRRKSYKRSESGAALREDKGLELKIDHHGIVMSSHSNSDGGEIEAIKFAALMAKLSHCFTSTHPDMALANEVLVTYPYFCSVSKFLRHLAGIYWKAASPSSKARISDYILQVIKHARKQINGKQKYKNAVDKFLADLVTDDVSSTSRTLTATISAILKEPVAVTPRAQSSSLTLIGEDVDNFPAVEGLAKQIALIDYHYYSQVLPCDLQNKSWMTQAAQANAAVAWTNHSNLLSRWVASRILRQHSKSARGKLLSKFIQLMQELQDLRCYNALMTIFMALNLFAISRLNESWKNIPKSLRSLFKEFEARLKPSSNFSGYREMLNSARSPCVPYLAVMTKDLAALDEMENEIERPDSEQYINWFKMRRLAKSLQQFLSFQVLGYETENTPTPSFIGELQHPDLYPLLLDSELMEVSQSLEATGTRANRSPTLSSSSSASITPTRAKEHKKSNSNDDSSNPAGKSFGKSLAKIFSNGHLKGSASMSSISDGSSSAPSSTLNSPVLRLASYTSEGSHPISVERVSRSGIRVGDVAAFSGDFLVLKSIEPAGALSIASTLYGAISEVRCEAAVLQVIESDPYIVSLHADRSIRVSHLNRSASHVYQIPESVKFNPANVVMIHSKGQLCVVSAVDSEGYQVASWKFMPESDTVAHALEPAPSFNLATRKTSLVLSAKYCKFSSSVGLSGDRVLLASEMDWQVWDLPKRIMLSHGSAGDIQLADSKRKTIRLTDSPNSSRGSASSIRFDHLDFSGNHIVSAHGAVLTAWNVTTGEMMYSASLGSTISSLSCDASSAVVGFADGDVVIRPHDEASEQIILSSKSTASTDRAVTCIMRKFDNIIVCGRSNGSIHVWNISKPTEPTVTRRFEFDGPIVRFADSDPESIVALVDLNMAIESDPNKLCYEVVVLRENWNSQEDGMQARKSAAKLLRVLALSNPEEAGRQSPKLEVPSNKSYRMSPRSKQRKDSIDTEVVALKQLVVMLQQQVDAKSTEISELQLMMKDQSSQMDQMRSQIAALISAVGIPSTQK